jgi:hypothetical protein
VSVDVKFHLLLASGQKKDEPTTLQNITARVPCTPPDSLLLLHVERRHLWWRRLEPKPLRIKSAHHQPTLPKLAAELEPEKRHGDEIEEWKQGATFNLLLARRDWRGLGGGRFLQRGFPFNKQTLNLSGGDRQTKQLSAPLHLERSPSLLELISIQHGVAIACGTRTLLRIGKIDNLRKKAISLR